VLAIEGEEFTPGSHLLSKGVQAAVQPAIEAVLRELQTEAPNLGPVQLSQLRSRC
jgi:hypothetical protein